MSSPEQTAPVTATRAFIDCTGHTSATPISNRVGAKGKNGEPSMLLTINGTMPEPDGIPATAKGTTIGAQTAALILPEDEHLLRILGNHLRDAGALLMRLADHKHLHPETPLMSLMAVAGLSHVTLISASPGDVVPGRELSDPECPEIPGLLDRPEVRAFLAEHGYGPDNENELMYLVTDGDPAPDGFPTLTVNV